MSKPTTTTGFDFAGIVDNLPESARETVEGIGEFFGGLGEFPAWKVGLAALFPLIAIGIADGTLQMAGFLGVSLLAGMALLFGGEQNNAQAQTPDIARSR